MTSVQRPGPQDLEHFLELVLEARDSGVRSLAESWMTGWTPKRPTPQEDAIIELLRSLDAQQRVQLLGCVRNFIDMSFFKFLSTLETGGVGVEFDLSMSATESGRSVSLIDAEQDNELRSKFFATVAKSGH